ncbi:MAG: ATP synthase F1 subunit delta [Archangium gephyra]|uniref:ATP synthase subunit delta n=1 Tax=Archangium gephyra TaxID=48 RepID=A0A2W5SZ64_9BACT|nr:MAG: ATP synthase F1 subunit delta [Archangium gephyra]
MSNVPVARRYARALLEAAGANADQVLEQLESLIAFFDGHKELFDTVASPTLTRAQRMNLVEAIVTNSPGLQPVLANVMRLLTDRNRFGALPFIARQYRDMVDSRMGRVRGRVTSASKLGDAELAALKKQLESLTQRSVLLETSVDPSLIGGVVANVGSHQYDGSIRAQLQELSRTLTQG